MNTIKSVSPDKLEPFSKWDHIGQGKFGDVYKVKHMELKIHVAVKKLKENAKYLLEELLAEAEKLKHASENYYVIQLFGIMEAPPCIVMQWMEYGCLGTLIEKVPVTEIPWALKYRILHEVAIGMNWLHSLSPPLLHLDLKPRNVLLNDALHIRITDFGLSKYTSSSTALGDTDTIGGTLEYIPPEAFQEGYKPSESTDIYSFAILSAVVLRGVDPYPIQCSALISLGVTQGQRPSFESLENIKSVKNLDKAIALTKRCWDNDKQHRPSFRECCDHWETFKSVYMEKEIKDAVKAVQNMVPDCTDFSPRKTDVQQSASEPNTQDMSDMIRQMETIDFSEAPSAKQEAVPSGNPGSSNLRGPVPRLPPETNAIYHGSNTNYRTGAEPVRNPQKQHRGPLNPKLGYVQQPGQMGLNPGPNSSIRRPVSYPQKVQKQVTPTSSGHAYPQFPAMNFQMPFSQSGFQSLPPQHLFQPNYYAPPQPQIVKNIFINDNKGPCQIGDNNKMSYGETARRFPRNRFINPRTQHPGRTRPASYPAQAQTSNIHIDDNIGPVQVGNNNTMFLSESSQYRGSYTKPIAPEYGRAAYTSSYTPGSSVQSPKPTYTSQVSLPSKVEEPFPDAAEAIQKTVSQTDQPLGRPTSQHSTVSNSVQGKGNINSSSSPEEQENSSKQ